MHRGRRSARQHLMCGAAMLAVISFAEMAQAQEAVQFNIPAQPLETALSTFGVQSRLPVMFKPELATGKMSGGVTSAANPETALAQLLAGSGLSFRRDGDLFLIVQQGEGGGPQSGSAAGGGAEVEGLIVTAQKREENIQDVPIAMSAFSQEALEKSQIAGGPDLITQVPNMTFTKTNFTSYSIQIRGIGTQAISATTDPAVAVAFNNTPFIRNRFFEQEFYDLERLEVLRGPQGTLYGRNATAGVVNLISAKPKFHYEAKAVADIGNYSSTRLEGMINIPLVQDVIALRAAGAWTKREGYAFNQMTGQQIDGRDLWSTRLSLRFEPTDWISANLIWEHFEEDDDRLRSGKQLCKKDPAPTEINGIPVPPGGGSIFQAQTYLSQGCLPVSLYSEEAFQTPNGFALPFYGPTSGLGNQIYTFIDPYLHSTQSRDLRVIESTVEPEYRTKSNIAELQINLDLSDALTLTSETSYSADALSSLQDYNRFTTTPGAFVPNSSPIGANERLGLVDENGVFCDPQLGCSDRLLLVDLSTSDSTQFSQELRLGSDFDGPFNFSLGANYLRHDAEDKYYVFINSLTLLAAGAYSSIIKNTYIPNVTDNAFCQGLGFGQVFSPPGLVGDTAPYFDPQLTYAIPLNHCVYIDPNPIGSLNDQGRNYFLSRNPYKLVSYAAFGELYYEINEALKLTAGLRFTVDRKTAPQIPSWLLASKTTGPFPTAQTVVQEWREPTGRLALDWKPSLGFTDDTLVYASYAHGYKAGGANPPPPVLVGYALTGLDPSLLPNEILPDTFGPEFVDAFELGTKNTLFDGAVTLNLTAFYYDYKGYQTSEIRNRSAVNSNFDAEVWGAEIEADWRPTDALKIGFKGGYNGTRMADGSKAIDLMDRTAGNEDWVVVRPFPTVPSNCIFPVYVLTAGDEINIGGGTTGQCEMAYYRNLDPNTSLPYVPNPTVGAAGPLDPEFADYPGFDPSTAPNGGRGFDKDLSGNELPNAPNYTATVTADYTVPLAGDWLMTLHGDYHYQSESWGRVINSDPYDRIEGFSTVNVAGIFANDDAGWRVMAYVKNVFDETAITGTFLNSDDTGLTTNVFLTEPRLYGIRVTKDFTGGGWLGEIGRCETECPLVVEIGGGSARFSEGNQRYAPAWLDKYSATFPALPDIEDQDLDWGDTRSVKVVFSPSGGKWQVTGAYRFGKTNNDAVRGAAYEHVPGGLSAGIKYPAEPPFYLAARDNFWRGAARETEEHEIADFAVGLDVGFGAFGEGGKSSVSIGMRGASLTSTSHVMMDGVPVQGIPPVSFPLDTTRPQRTAETYTTSLDSERGFEGVGPAVTWEGALRLLGDDESGQAALEWSVGGGVLFGKQTAENSENRLAYYFRGPNFDFPTSTLYDDVLTRSRTDDVTVPNVSLSLGLSYSLDRVKVSTGYSYDRFFDAIDGGYEETQTFDRTIHGPYLKLSLGFGG
jgi:iron complex outermembrane receptor protein